MVCFVIELMSTLKYGLIMGKIRSLRLEASSSREAARLAAVAALGMCVAVREKLVSPYYACDALFRPMLVQDLRRLGADDVICHVLDKALEIEDVADLVPSALQPLLDELVTELSAYLESLPDEEPGKTRCWADTRSRA